jgi:hypothetical protein
MNNHSRKIKASDHESYGMFTIIAILLAPVAFIMGIVYLTKSDPVDRKLGEHLLAFSVFVIIISSILWFIFAPRQALTTVPVYTGGVTTTPVAPAWDMESVYSQIAEGTTKEAVAAITGRSPSNCGETTMNGSLYESCSYGGVGDGGIIQVNYVGNIVTTKSKATY